MKFDTERDLYATISLLMVCALGVVGVILYMQGYYAPTQVKTIVFGFTISLGCIISIWSFSAAKFEERTESQHEMFDRCSL